MTTDEAAIRALIDQLAAAWAAGDADRYAALFTPDADYVTFTGVHYKGRREIAESHRVVFDKFQKGSRLDHEVTQIQFPHPDIALVHGKGAVVKGRQRRTPRNTKVQTYVATRANGEWRFAAFHNTAWRPLLNAISFRWDSRMAPARMT